MVVDDLTRPEASFPFTTRHPHKDPVTLKGKSSNTRDRYHHSTTHLSAPTPFYTLHLLSWSGHIQMALGSGRILRSGNPNTRVPTSRPNRHSSDVPEEPTAEDLLVTDEYEVSNTTNAAKYLEGKLLCRVGHPFTTSHLAES